jgi:glycosyltransferase involved in cell wall biosynthesis|tara:strand:+ start:1945 stop:2997 length:1053 start_codon:yes stop_codon:yes gene_type:complete
VASRKLIIQIPCFNEAGTLAIALGHLPREVPGYDVVEWLVIDDGSTDNTVRIARENGVDHVVSLRHNQGLARGFMAGLEAALKLGADTIVNTDADNQYDASCIPDLVAPIVAGEAEIVVGARPINETPHFSGIKKFLQRLGSLAVRLASNTTIPDAPSGFRAIHREAAMRMFVFSEYTYTLETIIQAGRKNMRITSVPVRTNEDLRPSRLVKSISSYVQRSLVTILRVFITYKPLRACFTAGAIFTLGAALLGGRFLWAYIAGDGAGKVQSLILLSVLAMAAFISFAVGVIAELQAANRNLLEDIRLRLLRQELAESELASQRARFDRVRNELAETDTAQHLAPLKSRAG